MTATCKEGNNLNHEEIKCVNISKIISVTNCQTLKFDYPRFTKSDFTTEWFGTRENMKMHNQEKNLNRNRLETKTHSELASIKI